VEGAGLRRLRQWSQTVRRPVTGLTGSGDMPRWCATGKSWKREAGESPETGLSERYSEEGREGEAERGSC
jgi:hypothetical protein